MISRHASPRLSTPQVQGPEPGPRVWGGLSPAAHTRLPIPAGVATDAKVGSELIQVLALDADIGNNSLVFYSILAIHYFQALANDSEDVGQVFTMGRGSSHFMACRSGRNRVCGGTTGYRWPVSHISPSIHPSSYPPVHLYTYPPTFFSSSHLLIHPPMHPFIHLHSFVCPSISPFAFPYILLSFHLCTSLSPASGIVLGRNWGARIQKAHFSLKVCMVACASACVES